MKTKFLFFIVLLYAFKANASELIDGIQYNLNNSNYTAHVTGWSYQDSNITIPETIQYDGNSYIVTSLDTGAFMFSVNLVSVSLPCSVTHIGSLAFAHCTSLTSIELPEGLESIGRHAFEGCSNLSYIKIPKSLIKMGDEDTSPHYTYNQWGEVGGADYYNGLFPECPKLSTIIVEGGNPRYDSRDNCNAIIVTATNTLVCGGNNTTIPNSVTNIGIHAFSYCDIENITLPNSLKVIESYAFYCCGRLNSITISNGVTSIGEYAFYYCTQLSSIEIPDNVTEIGESAFCECSNLTSVTIGNGITQIKYNTFSNTKISSIEIPQNVESIGNAAFRSCKEISEVIFHEVLRTICSFAFDKSDKYINVILPSTISTIGDCAFTGEMDKNITCYAEKVPQAYSKPFRNSSTGKPYATILTVPDVAMHEYARTYPWNQFKAIRGFSGETIDPVGITSTFYDANTHDITRYSIDGRRLEHPQKGLNIIRLSDGTVKKVMER